MNGQNKRTKLNEKQKEPNSKSKEIKEMKKENVACHC